MAALVSSRVLLSSAALAVCWNIASPGWHTYAIATTLFLSAAVLAITVSFWLAMVHALEEVSEER
jgi:hypothetical protein